MPFLPVGKPAGDGDASDSNGQMEEEEEDILSMLSLTLPKRVLSCRNATPAGECADIVGGAATKACFGQESTIVTKARAANGDCCQVVVGLVGVPTFRVVPPTRRSRKRFRKRVLSEDKRKW